MLPGPGVGWYRMKTNERMQEKAMMDAVGTKMERMKRARRKSVKLAMVGNGDHEGQSVVCGAGVVVESKQGGDESELVATTAVC